MSTNKQVNPSSYFYWGFELLWCSENYNMAHCCAQWAKLRKKVQFREAILFASRDKINILLKFFRTERSWKLKAKVHGNEKQLSHTLIIELFFCFLATVLWLNKMCATALNMSAFRRWYYSRKIIQKNMKILCVWGKLPDNWLRGIQKKTVQSHAVLLICICTLL